MLENKILYDIDNQPKPTLTNIFGYGSEGPSVELTIEQALQQGVAAHKQGKLQDAERLYRAILQAQPQHPDANHNLGVLAVAVDKVDESLPLFKTALEANPKIEQFWLSYIDALIKERQFDNVQLVLEQAKTVAWQASN